MKITVEWQEWENHFCIRFLTPNSSRCYGLTKEQLEHVIKEAQKALQEHAEQNIGV